MSEEAPADQWKQFLGTTPPNISVRIPGLASLPTGKGIPRGAHVPDTADIKLPPLELHCERDGGTRVFEPQKDLSFWRRLDYVFARYTCRNCKEKTKAFALVIECGQKGDVMVMKLGEFPPFSTPISPRIPKLLSGPDLDLYRKGVRSMDHGFGIGAASYFRRVVESQWELLVTEIKKAAEELGHDVGVYDAALKSHHFKSAVKSLKDAIPDKLALPDGRNPLTLLHQLYSRQLHDLSDEQCLQQAQAINLVLTRLLENIAVALKEQRELQAALSTLPNPPQPRDE